MNYAQQIAAKRAEMQAKREARAGGLFTQLMDSLRERNAGYLASIVIAKAQGRDDVMGWPVLRGAR